MMTRRNVHLIGVAIMTASWIVSGCSSSDGARDRAAVFAGSWYSGTEKELTAEVDGYLAQASLVGATDQPRPVALIAPHAGYRAAGTVTGYAYKAIQGIPYERVVVMALSHGYPFQGVSIDDVDSYTTPLGTVPLDMEACKKLREHPLVQYVPEANAQEHSLEIQIPFLQRALGKFKLIPITVGDMREAEFKEVSNLLKPLVDEKTLFVASSDFTHFGPRFQYMPFRDNIQKNIAILDKSAVNAIIHLDVEGFNRILNETHATICGRNPIRLLLSCLPANSEGCLVKYDTSGRIFGDASNSVSYASIVFRAYPDYLNETEQKTLLKFARDTIAAKLSGKDLPAIPSEQLTERLRKPQGAFVTIHVKEPYQLRGCIGSIYASRPLYEDIQDNAISASTRDPRFRPMTPDEMDKVEIEMSILSEMKTASSYKDIVLGTHGIVLRKGMNRALYLPQVPWEVGWEIEETLSHLSQKAGLSADAWREGTTFEIFTAQVFHE
ncbi:MAG TPA: AmmeMemoRadiSam system protein B [bacterium]|nr:AmmeMemoRadiSam system protein B [bacterium]HQQ00107.1 AmmeMemoRadiSam system protein B [bacterium]